MEKRSPAMRPWKENAQRTVVSSMADKDFFSSEQSHIMAKEGSVTISLKAADGTTTVLKKDHKLQKGEVIDATRMNAKALCEFFEQEINDCYEKKLMMSLHMKATMMKVSDPIIFGHCVRIYYKDVFAKHGALFDELKVTPNNGEIFFPKQFKRHSGISLTSCSLCWFRDECYILTGGRIVGVCLKHYQTLGKVPLTLK